MKIAVIASKQDKAGMNIASNLRDVYYFNEKSINLEHIDKEIDADFFIFVSKHQSKEGVSSLSTHTPGNWSKAEYGGENKKLCIAYASYLKEAFLELNKLNLPYEKTLEVTHHGPLLDKPCMFIEIGSSEKEWENKDAGKTIASIVEKLLVVEPKKYKIAFGIGGLHYAQTFNKIMLRTDIAVGHICPKYQLENLDKDMIKQAISRTYEKVDFVVLDWKGLGTYKKKVVDMLNELKIKYKRSDYLL